VAAHRPHRAVAAAAGTVVARAAGPFGTMLVVGSGRDAGDALYLITSDTLTGFGCTPASTATFPGGPSSCTGPPGDTRAEWPALTTPGAPVPGRGVSAALLGSVWRAGIGNQVTYAGHPLYLFGEDAAGEGPGRLAGEEWDEATLPPWHGVWYLMSPSGLPLAWPATLTTTTVGARTVVAAAMLSAFGWEAFPVYSFRLDSRSASSCTFACAVAWPPLITGGTAGTTAGASPAKLALVERDDGTEQLSYGGHPLYLFSYESMTQRKGVYAATGDGNGVKAFAGVFKLVTP